MKAAAFTVAARCFLLLFAALSANPPALAQEAGNRRGPSWLQLGAEIRGRAESFTGLDYQAGNDDAYYLHRLRLNAGIRPASWVRFSFQIQDARAPGYREPVPTTVENTFDVRGAFVELGAPDSGGWGLRVGRQELAFGVERLVGPSNWSNVSRVFDAARLSYQGKRTRLDWFAATLVQPDGDHLDRFRSDPKLFGFYSSFKDLLPGSVVEAFFFWKGVSEDPGRADVYTGGLRAAGPLPRRFDYSAELAIQGGEVRSEDLRSWAGAWTLGRTLTDGEPSARVSAEYDHASGDRDGGDGRRGTFDQLYPTNHSKYGIADRVGWRNMHGARGGLELKFPRRWSMSVDYWSFWLASRNDFLYRSNGAPVVRNPLATSNHVQQELDVYGVIPLGRRLAILAGYAHVFPGRFLKESTAGSAVTFFYAAWQLTL